MSKNACSFLLSVSNLFYYYQFKLGYVHVVLHMAIKEFVGTHFQKWRSHSGLQSHFLTNHFHKSVAVYYC